MSDFAPIDKSLARGLFKQEIRNAHDVLAGDAPEIVVGEIQSFADVKKFAAPGDLSYFFWTEAVARLKDKLTFPLSAMRGVARAMAECKLSPSEEIYSSTLKIVEGSGRKSFFETSFRVRPQIENDLLRAHTHYGFMKKERLLTARRLYPIVVTGHAVRRYLQRGDVQIGEAVLAPVLGEIYARAGLFIFLANIAGKSDEAKFAIPFKDGLLLCELVEGREGAGIDILRLAGIKDTLYVKAGIDMTVHPLLWGSQPGTVMRIVAKTYVGRREMKEGQVEYYDLIEGVYERFRKEITLISKLEGSFYPSHLPALESALEAAAPRLDIATKDVASAISWNKRLAYAFQKEDLFDASLVDMPSKLIALGKKGSEKVIEMRRALDILDMGGAPYSHFPHAQAALASMKPYEEPKAELPEHLSVRIAPGL